MGDPVHKIKAMTMNIRRDKGDDGSNNFCFRMPLIHAALQRERPDIIAFQEVLPHMRAWLQQELPGHVFFGCGRNADFSGEQVLLAVNGDTIGVDNHEVTWLSNTPDVPGSMHEGQARPRTLVRASLYFKRDGRRFSACTTHLDHVLEASRSFEAGVAVRHLTSKGEQGVPEIFMGDLNAGPHSDAVRTIKEGLLYTDISSGFERTYHRFSQPLRPGKPKKTDYIMISRGIAAQNIYALRDCANGVYLSDHYPLCAVLVI